MVTINFTIVVQLVLFLVFLWGLQRWVLGPMLATMDAREETIEGNRKTALADRKAAEELEHEYARSIAQARREAANILRDGQAEALQRRAHMIRARREEVDRLVQAHADEALALVAAERSAFSAVVPALADAILERLGAKETAST